MRTIGALIIIYAILGVPYYNYSILGPETLFHILRPLYQMRSAVEAGCNALSHRADAWDRAGGKEYHLPIGWKRFAVQVKGVYDDGHALSR